jgi:MOSC domain-containing protein YiiM
MQTVEMMVQAVLVGQPVPMRDEMSAITKQPVEGPVVIGKLGLAGDAQGDLVHHGGADKAVHLYPQDHYPFWRSRKPGHARLARPGAFGENIASRGLVETELCIGDRFTLGTAIVELSHGRQPCWKIDHHFGTRDMMLTMVQTARCGVYFRVLEEGIVEAGDEMRLMDRPLPHWTVDRVFRLLIGGEGRKAPNDLRALAIEPLLAAAWRERAAKLAGMAKVAA